MAKLWVHLLWLAMTCTHFDQDQICMQQPCKFFTVWPPNPIQCKLSEVHLLLRSWSVTESEKFMGFSVHCVNLGENLRVHLATQHKSVCKFNLWLLVTTWRVCLSDQGFKEFFIKKRLKYFKFRISSLRCASFCLLVYLSGLTIIIVWGRSEKLVLLISKPLFQRKETGIFLLERSSLNLSILATFLYYANSGYWWCHN